MKAKSKRVPTWLKTKTEVQALRQQCEELESFLLFSATGQASSTSSRAFIEASLSQLRAKTTAVLARQRRQAAEDENKRLKRRLTRCVKQFEAFRGTLAAAESVSRALRTEMKAGYTLRFGDASVFDMLEKRLDARVSELDEAFRKMAMDKSTDPQTLEAQLGGKRVELSLTMLLPFEIETSSSAMWKMVGMGKFPEGDRSRVVKLSDDAFAMSLSLSLQLKDGDKIDINGHTLIKRFATAAGAGALIESCAEWTLSLPDSGTWTHVARETGCHVIRQYCGEPGISQARVELCLEPSDFEGSTTRHRPMKDELRKQVVIPTFRELVASRLQFGENTLFDTIRALK